MADLEAGSLTVVMDAKLGPLEQGLDKAEQKVAQTDSKITAATNRASEGFGKVSTEVGGFKNKLTGAIGVIAGLAAVGKIISDVADGFRNARVEIEKARDTLDAFDKGTKEILASVPIFNQFAAAGRSLAVALGLAADEAKILAEATEQAAKEQKVFSTFRSGAAAIAANEVKILEGRGQLLEADVARAEEAFRLAQQQTQEIRFQASEAKRAGVSGASQLSAQADELERQAAIQKELALVAAERAEQERQVAKAAKNATVEMDPKVEQRQQRMKALFEASLETEKVERERLRIAELELQIATASDEKARKKLQAQLALTKSEQAFEAAAKKVNDLFDERIKLRKQEGGSTGDIQNLERFRSQALERVRQENEANRLRGAIETDRKIAEEESKLKEAKRREEEDAEKASREQARLSGAGDTAIGAFKFALAGISKVGKEKPASDQEAPKQTDLLEQAVNLLDRIAAGGAGAALT